MALSPSHLLAETAAIARRAGEVIMEIYEREIEVRTKADLSPVTAADEASENLILPALYDLTPGIPVVAEEAVAAGQVPDISGGRFWLVDPLDGTKEFISRNGEFTVNIALIEDGCPVLGVVHGPAIERTYTGSPGAGAACRDGGAAARPISARPVPAEDVVVVSSRSHGEGAELDAYLGTLKIASWRKAGSALKFCLLGAGEADIYPRFSRTMEWDTGAGHAVLVAAGGSIETADGKPLLYGKRGFENPHFIAFGRRD